MPAPTISLRRLSSRLNPRSCVVMAPSYLRDDCETVSQLDDSWANQRQTGRRAVGRAPGVAIRRTAIEPPGSTQNRPFLSAGYPPTRAA
jgi:hypothetical protein